MQSSETDPPASHIDDSEEPHNPWWRRHGKTLGTVAAASSVAVLGGLTAGGYLYHQNRNESAASLPSKPVQRRSMQECIAGMKLVDSLLKHVASGPQRVSVMKGWCDVVHANLKPKFGMNSKEWKLDPITTIVKSIDDMTRTPTPKGVFAGIMPRSKPDDAATARSAFQTFCAESWSAYLIGDTLKKGLDQFIWGNLLPVTYHVLYRGKPKLKPGQCVSREPASAPGVRTCADAHPDLHTLAKLSWRMACAWAHMADAGSTSVASGAPEADEATTAWRCDRLISYASWMHKTASHSGVTQVFTKSALANRVQRLKEAMEASYRRDQKVDLAQLRALLTDDPRVADALVACVRLLDEAFHTKFAVSVSQ